MIADFLKFLGEAATSTVALAAYVVVVFAWAFKVWVEHQPQGRAEKILEQFGSDAARNEALGKLLGERAFRRKDLMRWATLRSRERARIVGAVAYLATLVTAIVIVGMALFKTGTHDMHKPPVLVGSQVHR